MKTFILCDPRNDFLTDIKTSMLLESYPFHVVLGKSLAECANLLLQNPDAIVILSELVLKDADLSLLRGRTIYGYTNTLAGANILRAAGILSLGMYGTSEALLNALSKDPLPTASDSTIAKEARKEIPSQRPQEAAADVFPQGNKQIQATVEKTAVPAQASQSEPVQTPTTPAQTSQPAVPQATGGMQFSPEMVTAFMQMMAAQMQSGQSAMVPPPAQPPTPPMTAAENSPTSDTETRPARAEDSDESAEEGADEKKPSKKGEKKARGKQPAGEEMRRQKRQREQEEIDKQIEEDLLAKALLDKHKTRVISVYAAKGGVGKTSISTELAVCLALTTNGRRRLRVCIVDYNIDFGDVSTTLELTDSAANMSYWAAEIRELLERGQEPEDIQFTKADMEDRYLQKMKDTGLYALCAPVTHEDSMLIKPAELQTMLRNLIENGEFDYIICDTGNNTRDSSIIAIDNSDFVLLVATQDVTTANCNASVLRTLEDSGFNTEKVRLIINNVMPARETGISVQEVEETFPYKVVCRIKHTPDIIRANNLSRPLVYKPNHEYTKQIQRIVRFITAGELTAETEKRGLFGRQKR